MANAISYKDQKGVTWVKQYDPNANNGKGSYMYKPIDEARQSQTNTATFPLTSVPAPQELVNLWNTIGSKVQPFLQGKAPELKKTPLTNEQIKETEKSIVLSEAGKKRVGRPFAMDMNSVYAKLISAGRVPDPSETNPDTGVPYGVNPNTGYYDTNWYMNTFVKGLQEKYSTTEEQKLAQSESVSQVVFDQLYEQALKEYAPYYDRILKESGDDYNLAVSRLEEDYATGKRRARESALSDVTQQFQTEFPSEMKSLVGNLAQRGLLGTRLPQQAQPTTATVGEQVVKMEPTTPTQFGGLAGKKLAMLQGSQRARTEAVQRALKNREEDIDTTRNRSLQDFGTRRERSLYQAEQEKKEKAGAYASTRYPMKVQEQLTKQKLVYEPLVQS